MANAKSTIKKTAKKSVESAESSTTASASAATPIPKVRVRMFRQGLGDCFLLTFDVDGNKRHMLIDCGTLQDHLSGFHDKGIQKLKGKVDHVWLAWTENPADPDAQALAKTKQDLGEALAAVAAAAPAEAPVSQHIDGLFGFAGDIKLGADFAKTVNEAMEFVRKGLGATPQYFNPGSLIVNEWLPGFRFYVLGPPRSKDSLKDLGDHGSSELYGVSAGLRSAALMHAEQAGVRAMTSDERATHELQFPFDQKYLQTEKDDIDHRQPLKRQQYPNYFAEEEAWRKIDTDWLNLASDLALQLDSMTNNTSFAMAIERIADGKVLLFPADAQQGHWLSWHAADMKWTIKTPSGADHVVTAADLLARTVFYKVGHHSSHNATARGKGLELMQNPSELTAFIPVDRAVALTRNPKDSWQMPARPLYRRLLDKCGGRVARSDIGWAAKPEATNLTEKEFQNMATDAEWTDWGHAQTAASHVTVGDLFIEYILE
jgi:hypothetical protein